ncbi:phospholipase [Azoarcus sp. DD4]|uniref:EAL domain-containing protein n=1 Tax=Azoarcus sp. DD4 TaxID=2027405 RepID=UPI00112ED314|nr:EAL domain-containing protein [Azoarcus sp. DD4]QDF96733.1 phospholipase [Azoarcus sp. DD4]
MSESRKGGHAADGGDAWQCGGALAVLRAINSMIIDAGDEDLLLADACRSVVEIGGYDCAWIGYPDGDDGALRIAAACGAEAGEFGRLALSPVGGEDGGGLLERLRLGWSWQVPMSAMGAGSALAILPLGSGAGLLGVMVVRDRQPLQSAELALLHEAARSLAYGVATLRSTLARTRAEAELHRVERARRTLSATNRALVRTTDELALLGEICRVIVEEGGYRYAWVGYARRDESRGVDVMAHVGVERAHLEGLRLTWADSERGRSATGMAIRTGQPSIGRNILTDPDLAPWRDEALRRGYAAVSAFPLTVAGEVIGNLSIAAVEPDAFDAAEADLLGELAGDLAFGIETLRMRQRSREAEATIKRMAEQDALTGLPNRWRLRMRLEEEIRAARAGHRPFALLMLGIDHFQEINETLGYQQGDAMLCEVAARVARAVTDGANVARMGEAEFAVLLTNCDAGGASVAAQRILAEMFDPVAIGDVMLDAGSSIGIAVFPGHGTEPDALVRRANVAMHQARQSGHGYALYTGGRDRECARRLALIGDLHRAIEGSELQLYCQPKARFSNREICGVEALVRWQHPQLGMISPNEFIGLAEHSGLISPLTDWVMQAAFRQAYVWREAGLRLPMAVNLSARDLRDPRLVERVRNLLTTWGGEPEGVQFELTESALMQDPQGSLDSMKRLKDLGVELFIDDFGTGYSSLAYLQKLPVDAIKIDQSFVHDMLSNSDSAVIVRSTIDLAHDLDLEVVAEGVEDHAGWEHLAAQGCDVCQGYVLSHPIPAEAYAGWVSGGASGRVLM